MRQQYIPCTDGASKYDYILLLDAGMFCEILIDVGSVLQDGAFTRLALVQTIPWVLHGHNVHLHI